MIERQKIIAELAAHSIRIGGDGSVTIHGQSGDKKFAMAEACGYVRTKAAENTGYLLNLWREVADMPMQIGQFASNDGTRRMFISAVKHLVKQAEASKTLKKMGVQQKLNSLLMEDSTVFSQQDMSRFIDYRLAIDWVSHLVTFDNYRADLLEHLPSSEPAPVKTSLAQAMGRDFSIPSEQAIPWNMYRDSLTKLRGEETPPTEEKSEQEKESEMRSDQGLEDYDSAKSGLMYYMFEDKQKWMDHSADGWEWGDEDNMGPESQSTSIMGR